MRGKLTRINPRLPPRLPRRGLPDARCACLVRPRDLVELNPFGLVPGQGFDFGDFGGGRHVVGGRTVEGEVCVKGAREDAAG